MKLAVDRFGRNFQEVAADCEMAVLASIFLYRAVRVWLRSGVHALPGVEGFRAVVWGPTLPVPRPGSVGCNARISRLSGPGTLL